MERFFAIFALAFLICSTALAQGNGGGNGGPGGPATGANAVFHDDTLTGHGLVWSPLGLAANAVKTGNLADGAVTAPKLKTDNTAQAGQVLGFNGTGLTWQAAPGGGGSGPGPLRMVDSLGDEVGIPLNPDFSSVPIMRLMPSNVFVMFYVTSQGVEEGVPVQYFESTNCTGDPYFLPHNQALFYQPSVRVGDTFYYPAGSPQARTINSAGYPGGSCFVTHFTTSFYAAASVPVASLGVPPFRLAR